MDMDDFLAASGARRDRPCLIEAGRAFHADGTTTGYFWSTGRIAATVGEDWVSMKRRLGPMGADTRLTIDELRMLDVACADWARRRDDWARFFSYPGAPAPYQGFMTVYSYQPAGKGSATVQVGRKSRGKMDYGDELRGHNETAPLDCEINVTGDVYIDAETWRRGEKRGPPSGSLVGCRYRLGEGFALDADRDYARLSRGIRLEAGEEAFVAAVLAVVSRNGSHAP